MRHLSQVVRAKAIEIANALLDKGMDEGRAIQIAIARAERSARRKAGAFASAMSISLNFYINRAGRNLPPAQGARLQAAKGELRKLFGRVA